MRKRKAAAAAAKVISLITVRGPLLLGRATKQIQCPKLCAKNPLVKDDNSSEFLAKARVLVKQIWPTTFTPRLVPNASRLPVQARMYSTDYHRASQA